MKNCFLWLLMQLFVLSGFGQITLSGTVTGSAEPLPGASVVLKNTMYGVSANANGNFEFRNLKPGEYEILVSFVGFKPVERKIDLKTSQQIEIELEPDIIMTDEIMISALIAGDKTPVSYQNLGKDEIEKKNMGQDIPYLLQLTPSFVATSDAGTGIGYTNFRIRGTDMNRINVAVNGIPLNDAESHGTWFVDLPDIASSLQNVQIQRGVGTSSNGAAAFGATINMQTNKVEPDAYAEYKTAAGSFGTFKNTVNAGTGLINNNFALDIRLSDVRSDGFIDRGSANLKSYFISGGYYSEKSIIKAVVFSGYERTYQAWNGVPSELLTTKRTYNSAGEYTDENGNTKYYANQVDDYRQDHYQLHFSHAFNSKLNLNISFHLTRGEGFYENYKEDEDLANYQIPPVTIGGETIETSDVVNRKWLDNNFYGTVFSLNKKGEQSDFVLGGGYSIYDGNHFGKVIWGQFLGNIDPDHDWYRSTGLKKDFNIFAKYNYSVTEKLNLFADLQYRNINYSIDGIDDDLRDITQEHKFHFFNPKAGIFYQLQSNQEVFLSFATANREPNRDNYVDADPNGKQPVHETLYDWELGYSLKSKTFSFSGNLYYMNYKNQLVLTGEINDVGAPVMVNVDKSYRAGIELTGGVLLAPWLQWNGNATISTNKIKDFTEYVDNWDTWGQESFARGNTDLAFAPEFIGNSQFLFTLPGDINLSFISSYVGKQYIDNTSNEDRILNSWFVNNLSADYSFSTGLFDEITIRAMINNLFNEQYESNAWVYSYIYEGNRCKMDGYFPQAGTNFMIGVDFRF
jgi:iron complex outermembrane receptor protein